MKEGSKMFEYFPAENTPFMAVKKLIEDDKESDTFEYFCVCGPHRVTEIFGTIEEAIKDVQSITWAKIGAVIEGVMSNFINEFKNNNDVGNEGGTKDGGSGEGDDEKKEKSKGGIADAGE